jgi:hypothetical protein
VQSEPPAGRTFTLEEANELLPTVDRLLGQAQELVEKLAEADQAVQSQHWTRRSNGRVRPEGRDVTPERTRQTTAGELADVLRRVQEMGVVVRDLRSGLIDFPSLREGREVHLCWRRGEPLDIQWWHEVDAGFAGRQRLA